MSALTSADLNHTRYPSLVPKASKIGMPIIGPIAAPVFHEVISQTMGSMSGSLVLTPNSRAIVAPGVIITVELRPTSRVTKHPTENCRHLFCVGQLDGLPE